MKNIYDVFWILGYMRLESSGAKLASVETVVFAQFNTLIVVHATI